MLSFTKACPESFETTCVAPEIACNLNVAKFLVSFDSSCSVAGQVARQSIQNRQTKQAHATTHNFMQLQTDL